MIYSYRNELHIGEGFSGTGNLAARFDVCRRVGPFGGKDIAEDRDWGLRSRDAGYSIVYVPEMIVYHPARLSFSELRLKWDRHVAHDLQRYGRGRLAMAKWVVRSIAVAVSPIAEIRTVARSERLHGARQRMVSFAYLCGVRWYRAWAMIRAALNGPRHDTGFIWNVVSPFDEERPH